MKIRIILVAISIVTVGVLIMNPDQPQQEDKTYVSEISEGITVEEVTEETPIAPIQPVLTQPEPVEPITETPPVPEVETETPAEEPQPVIDHHAGRVLLNN